MYKVGDTLLCKHTLKSAQFTFIKNKSYLVLFVKYHDVFNNNFFITVKDEKNKPIILSTLGSIPYLFYSTIEIRKFKLKKLKFI